MKEKLIDAGLGISLSWLIVEVHYSDWVTSYWVAFTCIAILIVWFGFSDVNLKR